jgi:hypothetical protein
MKKTFYFIFSIALLTSPLAAFAGWPATDVGNAGTHGGNLGVNSNTTAQAVLKTVKDYGLDQVAYTLAQKLGQKMATASINKATGGASGDKDPNYIQDFGTVLSSIEQQQKDLYTSKLLASGNPFARDIAKNMLSAPVADVLPEFSLGKVLQNGGDWKAASKDISTAGVYGYDFYSQLAFPENTPIGGTMLAKNTLGTIISNQKETQKLKIESSGFLPNSECNLKISDYKNSISALSGSSEEQVFDTEEQAKAYLNANMEAQNKELSGLSEDVAGCIEEFVKNPVAATQTLTTEAGKFGMDMTKNIQGWGQIVAGLFVSLFNGFVNQGLGSLKADYGQVKQTNTGGPEQLYQKTASGGIETSTNFASAPVNIIDLRNDLEKSIVATQKNISVLKEARDQLFLIPNRLATLDMCLPGPDLIGLNTRLDKYYDQQTAWIQRSSIMGDDKKNNIDQSFVVSMLERDYSMGRAEMTQDMNDDTKNIPGASAMRTMINTFSKKKIALQNTNDSLSTATDALSQLNEVNSNLKKSVTVLQLSEPKLASLPGVVFTEAEWAVTPQANRDAIYSWMKIHNPNKETPNPALSVEDNKKNFVIKSSWGLWEFPFQFFDNKKWSDEQEDGSSEAADKFLIEKNRVRSLYNGIKDIIPSDWEISKNEQLRESIKADIVRIDNLIADCDKMREIIWGNTTQESGWFTTHPGQGKEALLAELIANKDTYFKSDDVKNSLTLPNIFTRNTTPEEDSCRPTSTVNYQAQFSSGYNFADHFDVGGVNYTCMGNFGHVYGLDNEGTIIDFNKWIDDGSNGYQARTFISWPTDLYWRARITKFIPPPVPDPYSKGWGVLNINEGSTASDDGKRRQLFCRFNSFQADYGQRSGSSIPHFKKGIFCSSKWADVSVSEAVGLFLINQLN